VARTTRDLQRQTQSPTPRGEGRAAGVFTSRLLSGEEGGRWTCKVIGATLAVADVPNNSHSYTIHFKKVPPQTSPGPTAAKKINGARKGSFRP
jgi:hypothetical protein